MENRLIEVRRERGWTQAQMAELAGITRQSYAAIESGSSNPSTEVALRLAAGIGCAVEGLFSLGSDRNTLRSAWLGMKELEVGGRVRLVRIGGSLVAVGQRLARDGRSVADGVVVAVEQGAVQIRELPGGPGLSDICVAGCDPSFGAIAESILQTRGIRCLPVGRNSAAALSDLARGLIHVAGVHFPEAEGDQVDRQVRSAVPFPCTRVRYARWEQGLVVPSGNPKGLRDAQDLTRPDVEIINREPGSGSRRLLDAEFARRGIDPRSVMGYGRSVGDHFAVAGAIANGFADAGVAIRAAANAWDLSVVPLMVERYDLIIPDHFLQLPAVGAMLDTLKLRAVHAQIEAMGGYDLEGIGVPA